MKNVTLLLSVFLFASCADDTNFSSATRSNKASKVTEEEGKEDEQFSDLNNSLKRKMLFVVNLMLDEYSCLMMNGFFRHRFRECSSCCKFRY